MPRSLPESSANSFRFDGTRGSVLLLHGFTGTPYELRLVGEALCQAGFASFAPLLPGHARTPAHLNEISAETWISSAKEAFFSLPTKKPRIVIGFSMGGLLASLIAAELKDQVDKLVLIAPAFSLRFYGKIAVWMSRLHIGHAWFIQKKLKGGDILDSEARKLNPSYEKIPVKALIEFDRLSQIATVSLSQITCPTLALFSSGDHTVNSKKSAKLLKEKLLSPYNEWLFEHSAHIIPLDFDRDELIEHILLFCESYASSQTSTKHS